MISVHAITFLYELRAARARLVELTYTLQDSESMRKLDYSIQIINNTIRRIEDGRYTIEGTPQDG